MSHASVIDPPAVATAEPEAAARSLDHLLTLEIPITVSFGEREVPLRELAGIGPGSVLALDRPPNAPVDLLVNGRSVARGELVVVDDQYAIRLTEVISTGERVLSLSR